MRKRPRLNFILGMMLAALLATAFAACGNDDDNGDAPDDLPGDDAAANGDDVNGVDDSIDDAADDEGIDDEFANGDDEPVNGDDAASLEDALESQEQQTFSITYEIESNGDLITMTIHNDPPRSAMSMQGQFEGMEMSEFTTINDGEDTYVCTADEGEPMCMRMEGMGADMFGDEDLFFLDQDEFLRDIAGEDDTVVSPTSSRTIAGQDADCFDVSDGTGDGTVCISQSHGVVLLVEGTFEGETIRMEVTDFSDTPDPDAFEPPYPVMDFGN